MNGVLVEFERRHPLLTYLVAGLILAVAIAGLVLLGITGVTRTSRPFTDFDFFYTAGSMWLDGQNPYDYAAFRERYLLVEQLESGRAPPSGDGRIGSFAYSPTVAPFFMGLALLGFSTAKTVVLVLNLCAVAALAGFAVAWIWRGQGPRGGENSILVAALLAGIVVVNPFTTRGIWLGQVTLPFAVILIGSWYFSRRRKDLLAGLLLGLVTMKPQTLVLPTLWFLLEGRFRLLIVAAGLALIFAAYPVTLYGPIGVVKEWFSAMDYYRSTPANAPGVTNVIGLPSVMAALGLPILSINVALGIAGAVTLALWRMRHQLCRDDIFGLLMALSFGLVFAHQPELVLLTPAVAALWLHLGQSRVAWIGLLLGVLAIFVPERVIADLGGGTLLLHRFTLVTWLTLVCLFFASRSAASKTPTNSCQTSIRPTP